MVNNMTPAQDDLGVLYLHRDEDNTDITIVYNEFVTAMYGPKGRKIFESLHSAIACALYHGFTMLAEIH